MDELRKRGYAFVLSSAAGFGSPAQLDRTVFAGVPGLPPEPEGDGKERNRAVTRDWLRWLEESGAREPFFAFLYYDPPLQNMPAEGSEPLALDDRYPAAVARRWRQYRLAARFVDREVSTAIDSLRARGLWDRTVVIVTSDHGYEFNDAGLGYVGHANAFTPHQLRTPLIVHWPGKTPREFTHRTSHHDLPPTLLGEVFGCTTDPGDYSVGRNLFAGQDWPWLIAGSYDSYAVVAPDTIVVSQNGLVEIRGPDYRPRAHLDTGVVRDALNVMARFYR
jgi:membrane-anchored protein YejM (alkaline phosphatase superfamily)